MVRIGLVGKRGASVIAGLRSVSGVSVAAICDKDPAVRRQLCAEHEISEAFDDLAEMLPRVDAVHIATPMHLHAEQAILALDARKHVLCEVTAAVTLEECWSLLDAVKRSGKTYMFAENYCYFDENVLVREMARKGLFGDISFAEGEYVHEIRFIHRDEHGQPTWRYFWQVGQRGNTYITHELGPVMQWIKAVDPEDRVDFVTCLGSSARTDPEHPHDDTCLTLVQTLHGRLIKLRLDMMSNRPGMTFYSLQGTTGVYESGRGGGEKGRVWLGPNETIPWNESRRWSSIAEFEEHYPPGWRELSAQAAASGHGGSDWHVGRSFAECLVKGQAPEIDIYDALEWTAAGLCSQPSIANRGVPIRVPNFRNWAERPITLDAS